MKVTLLESPTAPVSDLATIVCKAEDMTEDTSVYDHLPMKHAVESGHESVLEHCSFTFLIEGISRACSHQLVRHRIASFSQQSQRYVRMKGCFSYVTPKTIEGHTSLKEAYDKLMQQAQDFYDECIEAYYIEPEDARYILPNACCTNLIMTMNARELKHFLGLRLCHRAQWEIRELAEQMKELVQYQYPFLYLSQPLAPKCQALGYCDERVSCGLRLKKKDALKWDSKTER